jgi:tetratricopeptide (TPR) repeat protein
MGDRRGEAASLDNLGLLYQSLGEYERARDYHEKSLAIEQEVGDRRGEAASLDNLGTLYLSMGDPQKALSHFKRAYDIFLSLGERPHIQQCAAHAVESLFGLATASIQSGDLGGAVPFVDQAINYAGHSGHDRFLAHFTSFLVIPTLRKSEDLSSQLLPLVERFRGHKAFRDSTALLNLFEALLRFYEAGRAPAALNRLGPVEIFLVKSILDRIERHRHVEAGQLFEAGKTDEAGKVRERILENDPQDAEALFNMAGVLVSQGKLDEAEHKVARILERDKKSPAGYLLLSEIEQRRENEGRAVDILQDLLRQNPGELQAYPRLAQLLRDLGRFEALAETLDNWGNVTEDRDEQRRIVVWIPEAWILAGHTARARTAMPSERMVPQEASTRLLLEILRVYLSLYEKDTDAASRHALAALSFAADLPPGEVPDVLRPELLERAKEDLEDRAFSFFLRLTLAITQRGDFIGFADEFLSKDEVKALSRLLKEEQGVALTALHSGRLQGFRDLLKLSTRSIGPSAAILGFGDAYEELADSHKVLILGIWTEAIRRGTPAEVSAAFGAIGKNFRDFAPLGREDAQRAVSNPDGDRA